MRALALLALLVVTPPAQALSDLETGDTAWAQRAEGQTDGKPVAGPTDEAVDAYERASHTDPPSLEAHWKLLRALWFASEFVHDTPAVRRALLERSRPIADRALAQVAAAEGPQAARVYFWSALTLAAWSRDAGLLAAVRAGVANRLHAYALKSIELDPTVDGGGALRLLSRLHAELPRVPLLSGWVDRAEALPLAERAYATDREHLGNAYVLGLALLDRGPERRAEALRLIGDAGNHAPRPAELIEDLAVRRDARERLAREQTR